MLLPRATGLPVRRLLRTPIAPNRVGRRRTPPVSTPPSARRPERGRSVTEITDGRRTFAQRSRDHQRGRARTPRGCDADLTKPPSPLESQTRQDLRPVVRTRIAPRRRRAGTRATRRPTSRHGRASTRCRDCRARTPRAGGRPRGRQAEPRCCRSRRIPRTPGPWPRPVQAANRREPEGPRRPSTRWRAARPQPSRHQPRIGCMRIPPTWPTRLRANRSRRCRGHRPRQGSATASSRARTLPATQPAPLTLRARKRAIGEPPSRAKDRTSSTARSIRSGNASTARLTQRRGLCPGVGAQLRALHFEIRAPLRTGCSPRPHGTLIGTHEQSRRLLLGARPDRRDLPVAIRLGRKQLHFEAIDVGEYRGQFRAAICVDVGRHGGARRGRARRTHHPADPVPPVERSRHRLLAPLSLRTQAP